MELKRKARCLQLAIRAEQWSVDLGAQELSRCRTNEQIAGRAKSEAELALALAHEQRQAVFARAHFAADELVLQGRFEERQQDRLAVADRRHAEAQAVTESARDSLRDVVAQRDAYQHCLTATLDAARQEGLRQARRELDELWLLRPANDTRGAT